MGNMSQNIILRTNTLVRMITRHILYYATPTNLTYFWSFGSLVGIFFALQLITGIWLSIYYSASVDLAFESVDYIMTNKPGGWLIRYAHSNGASMIFILLYAHIGRAFYTISYLSRPAVWLSGLVIFILMMATAFLGYVLPWGQMSYWGATVITSLFSVIPAIGKPLVEWIWGGFTVGPATLNRCYTLHFVLPFITTALIIMHLSLLHETGSTAPLKIVYGTDKIGFWTYFKEKDSFPLFVSLSIFSFLILVTPNLLGHPDNFIEANPSVTPLHIVPEWYFTPFYAILRACPDKIGGVVGMGSAIALLGILPFYRLLDKAVLRDTEFSLAHALFCTIFFSNFLLLGLLGSSPANEAYVIASKYACFIYFLYLIILLPLLIRKKN